MVVVVVVVKIAIVVTQTVYASTSGRRMDTDKGPRERSVYPAVCWAADDYAEVIIYTRVQNTHAHTTVLLFV